MSVIPEVFTAEEVAERLQCHPETIMREARAGRLSFTRVGRLVRFTPEHVRQYLEQQQGAAWQSIGGKSGTTGSAKTGTGHGAERGSTKRRDKHDALRLANEILTRQ